MTNYEVVIPFKQFINAGQSSFEIMLPQSWVKSRAFYTEQIFIVPDYYSQSAAQYRLDPELELTEMVQFNLALSLRYNLPKTFYPDPLDVRLVAMKTEVLMKMINTNMESNKPSLLNQIPFFIDYGLADYDVEIPILDALKENAKEFFGEDWDASKHLGGLPASVRSLKNINNAIFPSALTEDSLENIRIRLWIGPHTKVTFSNDVILKQLGFYASQIGTRTGQNQFVLSNASDQWQVLEAVTRPTLNVSAPSGLRITVGPIRDSLMTKSFQFKLRREDFLKNKMLLEKLNVFLEKLGAVANIRLGLKYDTSLQTFSVAFETNRQLNVSLHLSPALSKRLGYKLTDMLDATSITEPVPDQLDLKDIEIKSKALVLDTGMVVVCLADASAINLFGTNDLIVTTLSPDPQGILSNAQSCFEPTLVQFPHHLTGPANTVKVTLKLFRLYEENTLKNFEWTIGCHIYGVLRGRTLTSHV